MGDSSTPNHTYAAALKTPVSETSTSETDKPGRPKMPTPTRAKMSVLGRLTGVVLNIIVFCIGSIFPENVTKGLSLVPFHSELGITVAFRTLGYTAVLVTSIVALKLLFGTRPTRAGVAQPLPATMWGILASWFWVLGTVVRYNERIKSSDIPKLWSVGGMTAASICPLLLAYVVLRRGASNRS